MPRVHVICEGHTEEMFVRQFLAPTLVSRNKVINAFLEDDYRDDVNINSSIDPINALRGCAKNSNLSKKLLQSRADDLKKEDAKWIK